MAPFLNKSKSREYIKNTNHLTSINSSDNSSAIPLLSEYPTSPLSAMPMSPFNSDKSVGASLRGRGISSTGLSTFAWCPAICCYRKPKCFLVVLALALISFLSIAIMYNKQCAPFIQNCPESLSHRSNGVRHPNPITNLSQGRRIQTELEEEPNPPHSSIASRQNSLVDELIRLNKNTGVSVENLINYTSIQQNGMQFKIAQNDVMVFLHIQKTGGTTFERHLVRDIDLEAPCKCIHTSKKRRKKLEFDDYGYRKKWFAGRCDCFRPSTNTNLDHTRSSWLFSRYNTGWKCGLHADWTELTECVDSYLDTEEGVTNRRYFYMAFLRDPITRYISEWKHVNRGATWKDSKYMCNGKPALKSQLIPCKFQQIPEDDWEGVSLKDFMECASNLAVNRQTRMMADLRLVNCYNTTNMSKSQREKTMLQSAKTNLERMAFFGITSEQAKSQYLFEDTFNLKFKVSFEAQNQHSKSDLDDLDEDTLSKIKALNSLDVELFQYAQELMQKRFDEVKSDDEDFDNNYHSLSRKNDEKTIR